MAFAAGSGAGRTAKGKISQHPSFASRLSSKCGAVVVVSLFVMSLLIVFSTEFQQDVIAPHATATAAAAQNDTETITPLRRDSTSLATNAPSSSGKGVNGVILFLSGGRWDSYFLRECLPRLEMYFLACHSYPVHIFHESLPSAQQDAIKSKIPSAKRVDFEDVSYIWKKLPNGVSELKLSEWMATGVQRKFQGRGYRIMCRFWAGLVWRLPSMSQYEYYWRLDTDSILTAPPLIGDPFVVMAQSKYHYGFNRLKGENPHVATNLWETYLAWTAALSDATGKQRWLPNVKKFALDPSTGDFTAPMFYNNFELGTMRLKRHVLYLSWFDHVDQQEPFGIFRYRWGDAPLHTLGVMTVLFAEGWGMHNFTKIDVGYRHAAEKPGPILQTPCVKV